MNITIIHGSQRKGSTYNIAKLFIQKLTTGQDKNSTASDCELINNLIDNRHPEMLILC